MPAFDFTTEEEGFGARLLRFVDHDDNDCQFREATSTPENCVWMGRKKNLGIDGLMLLTREQAGEIATVLMHFWYTGRLPLLLHNQLQGENRPITAKEILETLEKMDHAVDEYLVEAISRANPGIAKEDLKRTVADIMWDRSFRAIRVSQALKTKGNET